MLRWLLSGKGMKKLKNVKNGIYGGNEIFGRIGEKENRSRRKGNLVPPLIYLNHSGICVSPIWTKTNTLVQTEIKFHK